MVRLKPFAVEQWMDTYEVTAKYNIAETCCSSISLDELRQLSDNPTLDVFSPSRKLGYGDIRGLDQLRSRLASLYSTPDSPELLPDNILVTPGAISANHETLFTLVGPGDHVICHYPTYQQLYDTPAHFGAEVSLWKAKGENRWIPDVEELKKLVKANTKLLIINNPNNPTGATVPHSVLRKIVDFASQRGIIILSDEVYRPLFHSLDTNDAEYPPSILSMGYSKVIATGSLSKAYSLAGIRIGWIASRDEDIIEAIAGTRNYTTITTGQIDEQIAAYALSPDVISNLMARNLTLARTNLEILEKFIEKHSNVCSWVKPTAGTTAFIRFSRDGRPIDDELFCEQLQDEEGVMFLPGCKCFGDGSDFKGYVRVGYVQQTQTVIDGLERLEVFLKHSYGAIQHSPE